MKSFFVVSYFSAGVGRTGTFIVIDSMLDRVKAESTIDIFNFVAYLRTRRTAMVQTEVSTLSTLQYTFVVKQSTGRRGVKFDVNSGQIHYEIARQIEFEIQGRDRTKRRAILLRVC